MAKQEYPARVKGVPNAAEPLTMMAGYNGMAMRLFIQGWQSYVNTMAVANEEMAGFLAKRMQHDADFGQALAKCTTWADAIGLQQGWLREANEEYLGEASKLVAMASKAAGESWAPLFEQSRHAP